MPGKRAWAFCISFPDTLDVLLKLLQNNSYVDLKKQHDDILHYKWTVPNQAKEGDQIIYIVTPGNANHIISLLCELQRNSEEWSSEEYIALLNVLEIAKEEYAQFDGKLYGIAEISEIIEDKNEKLARFGIYWHPCADVRCYDNSIVKAERGIRCLHLTYVQTLEIIKSAVTKDKYNAYLFTLNAEIDEPKDVNYENQVQAFVVNNSFNKSLNEILQDIKGRGYLTIEALFNYQEVEWTVPRWCKPGDIAFFMFSKTANATMSALSTEFKKIGDRFTSREKRLITDAIHRGKRLYKQYGGCIFAFARVEGRVFYERPNSESLSHWNNPIYAPMNHLTILKNPVSIEEFRGFLTISRQRTITPVLGIAFDKLKEFIINANDVPEFFMHLKATPIPLQKVNNENWILYGMEYRRRFFLEEAFRYYYVDYLLRELGDKKTFYRECNCYKHSGNPPRVDNIILFLGKYLPVEVKLSIHNEANLEGQVRQYCRLSRVDLGKGKILENPLQQMWSKNVLIIDTENVYIYDDLTSAVNHIYYLDRLTDMAMIQDLHSVIESVLLS